MIFNYSINYNLSYFSDITMLSKQNMNKSKQQVKKQTQQPARKFCNFCKNLGLNPFGHTLQECKELDKVNCEHCGQKRHTKRYCPNIEKCNFCERIGHNENQCFYNPNNNIPRCQNCKGFGHTYIQCFYVSSYEKQLYKDKIQKEEDEQNKKKQDEEEKLNELKKRGITYNKSYLELCKRRFKENINYIPWVIFADDEDDEDELSDKHFKQLNEIKYQCTLLD